MFHMAYPYTYNYHDLFTYLALGRVANILEMGKGICIKNTMRIVFTSGSLGNAIHDDDDDDDGYDDDDTSFIWNCHS